MSTIKVLFFSDSHLGFDFPVSGKSRKIRRGFDFFDNFYHILNQAREKKVDLVIHGGDLFFRSKVPPAIVNKTYDTLFALADDGIPLVIVPGNHDRSTLPVSLFLEHPNINIFREPGVFNFVFGGINFQIAGFPYVKKIGDEITTVLSRINDQVDVNGVSVLCMHQAFAGATVGPVDYTFRAGSDVLGPKDLYGPYCAYLSGHIHRHQILKISGNAGVETPFIYPGSIERTAFAERFEEKGFMYLHFDERGLHNFNFEKLPSRPMHIISIKEEPCSKDALIKEINGQAAAVKSRAAILIQSPTQTTSKWLTRKVLQQILPADAHVEVRHRWLVGPDHSNK
ncbi:MAG: metallophosphoesterase family protein [Saprospiraceae bacterium]|nr:metallophosphoesterase family protein [Saprospiraceae bacterium]